jgi:hypothetical protein
MAENNNRNKYNLYPYSEEESFTYESCYYCGEDLVTVADILVDIEKDVYLCRTCSREHNIKTSLCSEIY